MKYRETKGYKYLLAKDEHLEIIIPGIVSNKYIILSLGTMMIKEDYAWDGSSIPLKKFIKVITFGFIDFDKYCKTASLVHDALCQLMREGLLSKSYKAYIDGLYRDMIISYVKEKYRNPKTRAERVIAKAQIKRMTLEANVRYRFLRMAGNWGITKEKNPRGQIKTA